MSQWEKISPQLTPSQIVSGHHKLCRFLVSQGADVRRTGEAGRTAFHGAILNYLAWRTLSRPLQVMTGMPRYEGKGLGDWRKTLQYFLDNDDVDHQARAGIYHPLYLAAAYWEIPLELVKLMVDSPKLDMPLFADKSRLGRDLISSQLPERLRYCLEKKVLSIDTPVVVDGESCTLVAWCLRAKSADCLEVLLESPDLDPMPLRPGGSGGRFRPPVETTLGLCVVTDDFLEMFQMLVRHPNARVNEVMNCFNERPIHRAASSRHDSFLEVLLSHPQVEVNTFTPKDYPDTPFERVNSTPLINAMTWNRLENVKLLCHHPNIKFHLGNNDALLCAISKNCATSHCWLQCKTRIRIIKCLLECGANPNHAMRDGSPRFEDRGYNGAELLLESITFVTHGFALRDTGRKKFLEDRVSAAKLLWQAGAVVPPNQDPDEGAIFSVVLKVLTRQRTLQHLVINAIWGQLRKVSRESAPHISFLEAKRLFLWEAKLGNLHPRNSLVNEKMFQLVDVTKDE